MGTRTLQQALDKERFVQRVLDQVIPQIPVVLLLDKLDGLSEGMGGCGRGAEGAGRRDV